VGFYNLLLGGLTVGIDVVILLAASGTPVVVNRAKKF
jgi:hypothetical protein